ncbi:MAG: hypothetical protein ACOY0T_03415 [Myxococcota bacterium]
MKAWLKLACLPVLSACQYVSEVNELTFAAAPSGDWSCLKSTQSQTPPLSLHYAGAVTRIASNTPISNVTARLCKTDDDDCVDSIIPELESPDGFFEFDVPGAFNGYIELESPAMLPAIVEVWRPIGLMRVLPELKMLDATTLNAFAARMSAEIDPTLGHALFWTEDCSGARASGVTVKPLEGPAGTAAQLAPNSHAYYAVAGRLPSVSVDRTDFSGGGGFINLPPTYWTFVAYRAEDQAPIARFAARIRPGHTTLFIVEPG